MQHTLSSTVVELFDAVNDEFVERLGQNYNPNKVQLHLQPEDLVRIANTMLDAKTMSQQLKFTMIDFLDENLNNFSYEVIAELAVVFALKMDETNKNLFFKMSRQKFLKELKYLKEETLYKIVWSLLKAEQLKITEDSPEWMVVRDCIISRSKELSSKVLTDLLLLSTKGANKHFSGKEDMKLDLFQALETDLILKMKNMALDDLINLMWTALEMQRGSGVFFNELEKEMAKRVRSIKDEQFETLIACFSGDKADQSTDVFSKKFLELILQVIMDKKDRFSLANLVQVIWACSRIDFTN
jgi:hypothetical protein